MIWRNFGMALRSINHNKIRAFLTMLGIIIGVSSVLTIIAVGEGVKQDVRSSIDSLGSNLINITPGQTVTKNSNGETTGFNPAASLGSSTLTISDFESISKLDTVDVAVPVGLVSGAVTSNTQTTTSALIVATTPDVQKVTNNTLDSGKFFTSEQDLASVAVVGPSVADELFEGESPLGKFITIRKVEFEIIGLLTAAQQANGFSAGPSVDNIVYIPLGRAGEITDNAINISEIDVIASSTEALDRAVTDITATLKQNHGGVEDFSVFTQDDILGAFDAVLNVITGFISAIASISLLVGGIGVANIMLVSVTERTREIGIRKAIGATSWQILSQFLIEAVVLSLLGGLFGIALAYGITAIVESRTGISAVFTSSAYITAVGVSGAIGVIFGIAPAIKAARQDPITSLRYE